jgi:FkbM family methyltransferase
MRPILRRIVNEARLRLGLVTTVRVPVAGRSLILPAARRSFIGRHIAVYGPLSYEPEVCKLLLTWPWQPGTFLDGGANIGLFAGLAELAFGSRTAVIAVEPLAANLALIEELRAANALRFEVQAAALHTGGADTVDLFVPETGIGAESIATLVDRFSSGGVFSGRPARKVPVRAMTLDAALAGGKPPYLIKLDIEGAEADVLAAAPALLARDDVDIVLEITINDPDKQRLFDLLRRAGFRAYLLTIAGLVREDRPLTIPPADRADRTLWRNHLFSKRPDAEMLDYSKSAFGYSI